MDKELLQKYGINLDVGLNNCMGDMDFYKMLLNMFLEDDCFLRARKAYAKKDYKELFACMHELKGVTGNAALTDMYKVVVPLVERLRSGDYSEAQIDELFNETDLAYEKACKGIALAVK